VIMIRETNNVSFRSICKYFPQVGAFEGIDIAGR
jgi:hypothetical protein